MENIRFDLSTLDVEKFSDVIHIVCYITEGTGLTMCGMRFDGGVVGFSPPKTEDDYVSYNLDHNILFLNYETLKPTQVWALHGIASMFDLTIKEFPQDA